MTKRVHSGVPFTEWSPEDDRLILAAQPLPPTEKHHGPSELQQIADRLGRSYMAVACRRSRLMRGVAESREEAAVSFREAHERCKVDMGAPSGQHDVPTSAREPDRPLDKPERPCAQCGRKFQPTAMRRMLCASCFSRSSSGE